MGAWTNRHRNHARLIRRLHKEDEEFRLLWDDYLLARRARRHFKALNNRERAEEYSQLCGELAHAVREYIDIQSKRGRSAMNTFRIAVLALAVAAYALPAGAGEVLSGAAVGAGVGMITGVGAGAGAVGGAVVGGVKKHNDKKEQEEKKDN
jgi:hypothetical protein